MMLRVQEAGPRHTRVRWREAGRGEPVVVLPGLGLSGRFYDANAHVFADAGFRFIVPDMPGLGGTDGPRTGGTVASSVRFALSFIDLLDLDGVHWIGHSIGAQHALAAAGTRPDRARSLTLVGPTGGHARGLRRIVHQAVGLGREALHAGARVIGAVARDYVRVSPAAYLGAWLRSAHDEPVIAAARVTCPVLFVVGTRDPVAERTYVESLAAEMLHARIAWIDGAGHALPRGRAAAFNAVTIAFLQTETVDT
jgi:pimeloyl-ACP methyl ester carboxylesterase